MIGAKIPFGNPLTLPGLKSGSETIFAGID